MRKEHFVADHWGNGDGYTFTLPTRLSEMLCSAEALFGNRDVSWTILGVEFGPDPQPQVWYPMNEDGRRHILIQLAPNALLAEDVACYQLAHEVVHLLAPCPGVVVPVIEEGAATMFSEDYVLRVFRRPSMTSSPAYRAAAHLVRELLALDPAAIRKLRHVEPAFRNITLDTFEKAELLAPNALKQALLKPFSNDLALAQVAS